MGSSVINSQLSLPSLRIESTILHIEEQKSKTLIFRNLSCKINQNKKKNTLMKGESISSPNSLNKKNHKSFNQSLYYFFIGIKFFLNGITRERKTNSISSLFYLEMKCFFSMETKKRFWLPLPMKVNPNPPHLVYLHNHPVKKCRVIIITLHTEKFLETTVQKILKAIKKKHYKVLNWWKKETLWIKWTIS